MASSSLALFSKLKHLNKVLININRNLRRIPTPEVPKSLEQRLAEIRALDPNIIKPHELVDIGLPISEHQIVESFKEKRKIKDEIKSNETLFEHSRNRTLKIDLDKVKEDEKETIGATMIKNAAQHYNVYKDLFHHGIFTPQVFMDIHFDYDDETVTPVYRGNIILPCEAEAAPHVIYKSNPDELWSLILTNPDGHFSMDNSEYIHWFIGNIKGNDLKTGEEVVPYLQPIPSKGTGYHRMIFILYKQDKIIDYSSIQRPSHKFNLESRTFNTFKFYQANQDFLTPAGLSFFQSTWDDSLVDFFHEKLEMNVPVYEYMHEPEFVRPQRKFAHKKPFNRYLDQYRDIQDIRKEVLLKRLKTINPFEEEAPIPKYPNVYIKPKEVASWQKADLFKERFRIGKFRDLRPHSAYEQSEYDFSKVYETSVDTDLDKIK